MPPYEIQIGLTQRSYFIIVPPKIMPFQFMNSVLREGMRAAVSCQLLEGDRPIDIIWEFNGSPINAATSTVSSISNYKM